MNRFFLEYILIRALLFPIGLLPFRAIHAIGRFLGSCAYHLIPSYRKRALSNLALARDLNLSEKEIIQTAKASFQNLAITALEYGKFARLKKNPIICENPEKADELMQENRGLIFFVGHQANWETLFLDGTARMPGVAIGRPIKNPYLYRFIVSVREKFGGKIVAPKNAIKEGLRALKQGKFLGIVGDQGMPESSFSSPFLGRNAYTSPIPALLSAKTKAPIMVATVRREKGKYFIRYSDPLFPDPDAPLEQETERLMKLLLGIFEKSVRERPHEWLWQHNRWKQETPKNVYYAYRYDAILIIAENPSCLETFRKIYPRAFITLLIPEECEFTPPEGIEKRTYTKPSDLLLHDYRFKLVINLTSHSVARHYLKLSAFKVIENRDEKSIAKMICREGVFSHAT